MLAAGEQLFQLVVALAIIQGMALAGDYYARLRHHLAESVVGQAIHVGYQDHEAELALGVVEAFHDVGVEGWLATQNVQLGETHLDRLVDDASKQVQRHVPWCTSRKAGRTVAVADFSEIDSDSH